MRTKVVGFIVALLFMFSSVYALADEAAPVASDEFKLLSSIGFFEGIEADDADKLITRGEFAKEAAYLTGYDGETPVEYLKSRGVISGDTNGNIRENDIITGYEAIKILVSSLDYDLNAQAAGGYPTGYYLTAQQLDIIPAGFEQTGSELTFNDAAKLLTGAGNAVVANHSYYVDNEIFINGSTDTAFYKYHNILVYQGIVNANEYTGFEGASCGQDSIRIGSDILAAPEKEANEYLGFFVRAYCVRENGESVVKYIYPVSGKNRTITISSDSDPVASGSLQEFTVAYYDENDKAKNIRVGDYYPFYNNKYYAGFSLDKISSVSGTIEFIDNDSDNIYEIVKINDYKNYIVDGVNIEKRKIFDKYGRELTLPEDDTDCIITGQDGNPLTLEALVEGDVMYVLESEDKNLVIAEVSRNVASGTVVGTRTVGGRTIIQLTSNREYELLPEFEALVHDNKVEPEIGLHVQLKLDINGKVVDVVLKSADTWVYGFVTGANVNAEEDATRWLKIYNQNKKLEKYNLAEKIRIDGVARKSEVAFNYMINPSTSKVIGQLIKYKLDGSLISQIDTVIPDNETDSLTRMEELDEAEIYYHKDTRMFFNGFETVVGGNSKTLVFNVPDTELNYNDVAYFSVTSPNGIGTATGYNAAGSTMVEAYDVDELNIAKVLVRYMSDSATSITRGSPHLIFRELITQVDSSGEVKQKLVATNPLNGNDYGKFIKEGVSVPELQFGDVIRYVEKGGEVSAIRKDVADRFATGGSLNKLSEGIAGTTSGRVNADTDDTYVATVNIYQGKIQKIGSEHISMSADLAGNNKGTFMVSSSTPIYVCSEGYTHALEKITINELRNYTAATNPDANTCIVTSVGAVKFIIVYSN